MFTYVKNKEAEPEDVPRKVSGMLLYARTDEEIKPDATYRMSGNRISVRTLDLGLPFGGIRTQLDGLAEAFVRYDNSLDERWVFLLGRGAAAGGPGCGRAPSSTRTNTPHKRGGHRVAAPAALGTYGSSDPTPPSCMP